METASESDYRDQLSAELARRRMANPQYSLRAFARGLELSPAFVSKLLRGEKDISMEKALSVAEKLGYNETQTAQFCQLVQIAKAKTPGLKDALGGSSNPDGEFAAVSLETFQVISDWYHYAILELATCAGGELTGKLISERLGISIAEARAAMNRLIRVGLLKNTGGRWKKSDPFIATPTDRPNRALRNFHTQMIEKAKVAIETQPVEERDITGTTLAISADKVELAKKEIRNFRRKMAKLLASSKPTEVYQLNVQFFALSRNSK